MFLVLISKSAKKFLLNIEVNSRERLKKKMLSLENFPEVVNVKKIQGRDNLFRLRAGNFRVVFKVFKKSREIKITIVRRRNERTYK